MCPPLLRFLRRTNHHSPSPSPPSVTDDEEERRSLGTMLALAVALARSPTSKPPLAFRSIPPSPSSTTSVDLLLPLPTLRRSWWGLPALTHHIRLVLMRHDGKRARCCYSHHADASNPTNTVPWHGSMGMGAHQEMKSSASHSFSHPMDDSVSNNQPNNGRLTHATGQWIGSQIPLQVMGDGWEEMHSFWLSESHEPRRNNRNTNATTNLSFIEPNENGELILYATTNQNYYMENNRFNTNFIYNYNTFQIVNYMNIHIWFLLYLDCLLLLSLCLHC